MSIAMESEIDAGDEYRRFIESKSQVGNAVGFDPLFLPDFLHGFQGSLVDWAVNKGRAAIFADCGLGKTPMQLVWAQNMVLKTNRPAIIFTPLAVGAQTVREGSKFGIECHRSRDGKFPKGARIVVTNYEQIDKFNPSDFAAAVGDESGGIKHFRAARTANVIEFFRTIPYRLLCTATAAPNDYPELGTSAEALGEMGFQDMLTKFFKKRFVSDFRGWNRQKYDLRAYAERDFWRWVCSWARACRRPSDLGFDDGGFILPPLETREHIVSARTRKPGYLFDMAANNLEDQREERRRTLKERCEKVAELVSGTGRPAICWGQLNDECDLMEKLIPGAVQVSGSDPDDLKEERFLAFEAGQIRVLISKSQIAGYGLNWQHCAHMTFFPTYSFEQVYQSIRRCLRYGQKLPVTVDMVASEGDRGVLEVLKRKEDAADALFTKLVALMNEHLNIQRGSPFVKESVIPGWIS